MANPEITLNDGTPLSIGPAYKAAGKTILTGQGTLAVGSVLGVITASQKLKLCAIANGDGSEVARFILMKETDTSSGDVTDQDVLKAGVVNGNKLTFGGTDTIASVVAASGLSHDENLKANGIIAVMGSDLEAYDNT
jgi:hypothetical protein